LKVTPASIVGMANPQGAVLGRGEAAPIRTAVSAPQAATL